MSFRLTALTIIVAVALMPASAARQGRRYNVGGTDGWRVPPPEEKEKYYVTWASNITFYVGDSLEFIYKNDSVIPVDKAGYYHCTGTPPRAGGSGAAPHDGSTLIALDAPGFAYFASADLGRCKAGERLMINVLAAGAPGPGVPAQGPSSAAAGCTNTARVTVPGALALVAGLL